MPLVENPFLALEIEAESATTFRNHSLRAWKPLTKTTKHAECRICGMEVVIDIRPPANGIDIAGKAVAMNCTVK